MLPHLYLLSRLWSILLPVGTSRSDPRHRCRSDIGPLRWGERNMIRSGSVSRDNNTIRRMLWELPVEQQCQHCGCISTLKVTYYDVFPTNKNEFQKTCFWSCVLEKVFRKKNLTYRYSPLFQSFQNVLFLVSVALMQISCCHCIQTSCHATFTLSTNGGFGRIHVFSRVVLQRGFHWTVHLHVQYLHEANW